MKLSTVQERALNKLKTMAGKWESAYGLQESRNTLESLVKMGLLQTRSSIGYMFDSRLGIEYRVLDEATKIIEQKELAVKNVRKALQLIAEATTILNRVERIKHFTLKGDLLKTTLEEGNAYNEAVGHLQHERVSETVLVKDDLGGNLLIEKEKLHDGTKVYGGPAWVNGTQYHAIVRVRFDSQAVKALKPYQVSAYYFKKYYAETANENALVTAKEIGQVYVSRRCIGSKDLEYQKVQKVDKPDPAWQGGQEPYMEGNSQ